MAREFNEMTRQEQDEYIRHSKVKMEREAYEEYVSYQPETLLEFKDFNRMSDDEKTRLLFNLKKKFYKNELIESENKRLFKLGMSKLFLLAVLIGNIAVGIRTYLITHQ